MSRILFSPESFNMGETTRCIEIARVARERGHTVLFHVYSPKYIGLLESAGLPAHLREPIMSDAEVEQIMALDQGRGVRHPFTTDMVRRRVAAELSAIRDFNADAVVIGSNLTMLLSAHIAGVPIFYARPYAYSSTYFSKKPVGGELAAPGWLRAVARVCSYKPASFARVAREYGLRLPRRTVDMLSADVNLICSLFTQLRGDSLVEPDVGVGPIYYRAPGELPQIVREPRERPLIYVGMGSSGSADILARVLRQLSAAPVDVLVGGGVQLLDARCWVTTSISLALFRRICSPVILMPRLPTAVRGRYRRRAWRVYRLPVLRCRRSRAGILRSACATVTPCALRRMMCAAAICAIFWTVCSAMRVCVLRRGSWVKQCALWMVRRSLLRRLRIISTLPVRCVCVSCVPS